MKGEQGADGYHPARAMANSASVRTPRWAARKKLMALGLVSALFAAGVVVVPVVVANADPESIELVVNSAEWGGADITPGDGVCETATGNGKCTLKAAIMESNELHGQPGQVSITVDPTIAIGTKMTGTFTRTADCMSSTERIMNGSSTQCVYYYVKAPVTIDLGHRLQADRSANGNSYDAMFYLNGPDIQMLNADQVMVGGASFVVGPLANRVTINGDTINGDFGKIVTPNSTPREFVIFRDGASNVTVRNYQVTGYLNTDTYGGIFVFDSILTNGSYAPLTNIVIDSVQALSPTAMLTNFWSYDTTNRAANAGGWVSNTINGLTFTNMVVQNMSQSTQWGFYFGNGNTAGSDSVTISDLTIENNVFLNNRASGAGFIILPYGGKLTGISSISNNVFTRASPGSSGYMTSAIYYYGTQTANSTNPSQLTIANNYFNGYTGGATIYNRAAGLVTVTGNAFGPSTGSVAAPGTNEEFNDSASVMYNTYHGSSSSTYKSTNQSIRTWAPSAPASVLTDAVPSGTLIMNDPREGAMPTCPATVQVNQITATNNSADNYSQTPGSPVTLQAYWTGSKTAEVYLGQVTGVNGISATLEVQLPVGTLTLPDGTTTKVVDATTGAAAGYIRLQTHVEGLAQLESSQYSRMVAVSGNCRPALTIKQASGMVDPTYGRDLHFTLTSTVPLDPGTVTADDITLDAAAIEGTTIDENRINPRVISVEPVPGSNNMEFDVIVRVDDSASVAVSLDAEKVATTAGLTNQNPANYNNNTVDHTITYLNPLHVNPSSFTVVTGEPNGKTFTISVAAGAPVPQADLMFTATVTQPAGTPLVSLSTTGPILRAGETSVPPVVVKAAEGDVTANTPTTITMIVESSDPEYDGLVVPSVTPYLFSTDPTVQVVKQAYTDMTDTSSPQGITSTGTLAPSGTRLMDRQPVCFVYTVSNVSRDDWTTSLMDIQVTDSDTRLGINGLIGVIPTLSDGDSTQLSWCTSLQPVDTTIGN